MPLKQHEQIAPATEPPIREEIEFLLYRYITALQLNDAEDSAIARAVLNIDAQAHIKQHKNYYQKRFAEIRKS
jgi:hypothetical protein